MLKCFISGTFPLRTYVVVTLRNVNLWSCLGMSIWTRPQESGIIENVHYTRMLMEDGVGGGNTPWQWRTRGHRGWAFATYVFGGVKCRNKC